MPPEALSTIPPTAPQTPYNKSMNKTKMTHEELLAMVMAEEAYRQKVRSGEIAPPQVQSDNWYISDRH